MMYVSVDPAFQRQGISRRLIEELIGQIRETPRTLIRSRSSHSAPAGFQAFVDQALNAAKIPWQQGNRSANIS